MKFLDALKQASLAGFNPVIPDIKSYSPKDGDLISGRDPIEYAKMLVDAGAPVLSVVTEKEHFHGSISMLQDICKAVDVPVLRKDFIQSESDLIETKQAGATAVLLMYSQLGEKKLSELYLMAKEIGLETLVECHESSDLKAAEKLRAPLVGINNRNISIYEVDDGNFSHANSLLAYKPEGSFLVVESAIRSGHEVRECIKNGADAALVGTALLQADDPASFYKGLRRKVSVKLCGFMNEEGINMCRGTGLDILGFVSGYPVKVPWDLDAHTIGQLIKTVPDTIETCVVTGGSEEHILEIAEITCPSWIQLHHKEPFEVTRSVTEKLHAKGIKVMRTVLSSSEDRINMFGSDKPEDIVKTAEKLGIDALLLDGRVPENASLINHSAPMAQFKEFKALTDIPVILAGGITYKNAKEIIRTSGAEYIDIMTGVEITPGIKSPEKITKLFAELEG
jgi:indole-3-glycerol phosphate synthase